MVTLSDIKDRARQAVSRDGDDESGTDTDEQIDQEQARIERARQEAREEARRQAQREQVQEAVEEAREEGEQQGRQDAGVADASDAADDRGTLARVTDAIEAATERVADADGEIIDDIDTAMSTDFDGNGEPFAAELGLQTNDRAAVENQAFGTLGERVTTNEQNITQLEGEVFGSSPQQQGAANVDRMSPGGVGGMGASLGAGAGLDGGLEPVGGMGGLGGADVGGPSGGLSGGLVEVDEGAANEAVVETSDAPGLREMGIDPEDGL